MWVFDVMFFFLLIDSHNAVNEHHVIHYIFDRATHLSLSHSMNVILSMS